MRQKLIEAYDYSPPSTPGYLNEAVNDIQAKVTKDGVVMTNISDISNTKNPKSTTNLNKVGSILFNNGMKMTNNAISGVDTISTTNLNNVGSVSFTSGLKLSPRLFPILECNRFYSLPPAWQHSQKTNHSYSISNINSV